MNVVNIQLPIEANAPEFVRFHSYWKSKSHGNNLPSYDDFNLDEVPDLTEGLAFYEVERVGNDYRFIYRGWGEFLETLFGRNFSDRYMDEVINEEAIPRVHEALSSVVETHQPHYWEVTTPVTEQGYLGYRRLVLPLASDGETVDWLVGFHLPSRKTQPTFPRNDQLSKDGNAQDGHGPADNRRSMEVELLRTQILLEDAIENIPGGLVLWDADDRLIRYNSRFAELYPPMVPYLIPGIRYDDLVRAAGKMMMKGMPETEVECWIEERLAAHQAANKTNEIWLGNRCIAVTESRTREGGIVCIHTDITDQKKTEKDLRRAYDEMELRIQERTSALSNEISERRFAETALRQSKERFRDIAESASDWFWEMDADLRFTYLSNRFYEITGRTAEQIIGRTREEMIRESGVPSDPESWLAHLDDLAHRRPFQDFEYALISKKSQINHLQISGKPIFDDDGVFLGYRGAARDITAFKRWQAELKDAKEEAERANKAKSDFLAKMSHELRTPLNAVIGLTEMMEEDAELAGHHDYLEPLGRVRLAGGHLLALINDILDIARIEAGKMPLNLELVEVSRLVQEVYMTAQPLAKKSQNDLQLNCPENLGTIMADQTRLRQVLLNLLSNACKFTENGRVILAVEQITTAEGYSDRLAFKVADTGIGIDDKYALHLFDEFVQADEETTLKYGGTGLGLAICRKLTDMMDGTITVKSEKGKGSVFTVSIPVDGPRDNAPEIKMPGGLSSIKSPAF